MGIYTDDFIAEEARLENPMPLIESFILEDLSKLSDDMKQEFIDSPEAQSMIEAGLIGKNTLVRLSKKDDLSRRQTMACIQLAQEANDPLFDQLAKNRVKERKLLDQIRTKYGTKGLSAAKSAQKDYLKRMPSKYMAPPVLR